MATKLTLDDIRSMNKDVLTAEDAGSVLGCAGQAIRAQARKDKSMLGFPVIVYGNRVRIPKLAFIEFFEHYFPEQKGDAI